jgi:hypothetical protein
MSPFSRRTASSASSRRAVGPASESGWKELRKRVKQDSAFVTRVMTEPKLWLIDDENASPLENLCGPGQPLRREDPDAP